MNKIPTQLISQYDDLSSDEIKRLLVKSKQGDKEAEEKIVKANLKLVLKIAHRFKNSNYSLGDIFQVGIIGLLKAVKRFDLSKEVKFSTYAVPLIIGEIKMFLRDNNSVKISRNLNNKVKKVKQAKEELAQKLQREPTIQEISRELDLSLEEIVTAMEAGKDPTSLYNLINKEEDIRLIEQLGKIDGNYNNRLKRLAVTRVLKKLNSREKKIISLRYVKDKTQQEAADLIGISQAHLSRLEAKILDSIRKELT